MVSGSLALTQIIFETLEVGMSSVQDDWVRLPGLFRWDEVCDVFAMEAVPEHEWRFLVQLAPPSATGLEPLYVVHATDNPVRRSPRRRLAAVPRDVPPEMPAARDPSR